MVDSKQPRGEGETLADRYVLGRLIGAGTMGTVHEAHDRDGTIVAVKQLLLAKGRKDSDERRARFSREAMVAGSLSHPNILPVLGHGIDEASGVPYLVMPLASDGDLGSALAKTGSLPPDVAVSICLQACRGLDAAHRAGVIHRDVKPQNLLLDSDADGRVTVKVADFGLAKVFGPELDELTRSGTFIGTAHYVSPEQATSAKHVDARSDVWSIGMTLYHALAGSPAFAHVTSFIALVLELTGNAVKPLQAVAPWIPASIAAPVHGSLIRDVEKRCPTIADFAVALEIAIGLESADRPLNLRDIYGASADFRKPLAMRIAAPQTWAEVLRM